MKRTPALDAYFSESFDFGGERKTRAEIITYLRSIGGTPAMIDRYLFGLDLSKRLHEQEESK